MANAIQTGPNIQALTASATLGYLTGQTVPPLGLVTVSGSAGSTLTIPILTMSPSASGLGYGDNTLRVMNLSAQPVTIAADGSATIIGSTATVAQNATIVLISNSGTNTWYRLSA